MTCTSKLLVSRRRYLTLLHHSLQRVSNFDTVRSPSLRPHSSLQSLTQSAPQWWQCPLRLGTLRSQCRNRHHCNTTSTCLLSSLIRDTCPVTLTRTLTLTATHTDSSIASARTSQRPAFPPPSTDCRPNRSSARRPTRPRLFPAVCPFIPLSPSCL